MPGAILSPGSNYSPRPPATITPAAAILLIVLSLLTVWLMALPVSSLSRPSAAMAAGARPSAKPAPLEVAAVPEPANEIAETAGQAENGIWEVDETIPGSRNAILGKQSLAIDAAGNAYAIWETTRTETSYCETSRYVHFSHRPAGGAWSTAITIAVAGVDELVCYTTEGEDMAHSAIAVGGDGRVHVLYVSHENDNWNMEHSSLFHTVRLLLGDGGFWSNPLEVCDQAPRQGYDNCAFGWDAPEMHLLPNGNLIGVWAEDRLLFDAEFWNDWVYTWGLYTAVYENGNWGAHERVSTENFQGTHYNRSGDPFSLAAGANGRLHALWDWADQSTLALRYTNRDSGSATWRVSLPLSGQTDGEDVEAPRLAASRAGGVHALWSERAPAGSAWTLQAAYGQESLGGQQPIMLPGTTITLNQHAPDIAVDSTGNAYAAWVGTRTPGECCWGDLYVAQRTAGITGTWSLAERVNVSGTYVSNWQAPPDIVVDKNDKPNVLYKSGSDGLLHVARRGTARQIKGEVRAGDLPLIGVPVSLVREDAILAEAITTEPRGAYVLSNVPITTNLVLSVTLEYMEVDRVQFRVFYSQTAPPPLAYAATLPFTITAEDQRLLERDIPFAEHREITTSLAITREHLDDLGTIYYHLREARKLSDKFGMLYDDHLPLDIYAFSTKPSNSWSGSFVNTRFTNQDPIINLKAVNGGSLISDGSRGTVEWHEYGHGVMAELFDNLMPKVPGDSNHWGYSNSSTTDSWTEGFAEFYALMVGQHVARKDRPDLYHIVGVDIPMEPNYLAWTDRAIFSPTYTFTLSIEEYAVAGLLWDLVDEIDADDVTTFPTGTETYADCIQVDLGVLWSILSQPWGSKVVGSPAAPPTYTYVFDVKHLYDVLRYEKIGTLRSRGGVLDDLQEIFVAHGFFEDANANHVYDAGESVGTSGSPGYPGRVDWPNRPLRRSDPPIGNSIIAVAAQDGRTQAPVHVHELLVDVRFPPPLDYLDYSYTQSLEQTPGKAFFLAPDAQYRAVAYITAKAPGWVSSEPLILTSAAYWQAIKQATGDHFLDHTFRMTSTFANRVLLPLIVKNWQSGSSVSVAPAVQQPALRSTRTPRACAPPPTPNRPTPTQTWARTPTPTETATATGTATPTETATHTATHTATTTRTPIPLADLTISKSGAPDPVAAGSLLTYTISVTNLGTAAATGVVVVDALPAGVSYAAHSATQGTYNSNSGQWSIGTIVTGAHATLYLGVTVQAATVGIITNTASVSAVETDPNPANNSISVGTTVYASGATATATGQATATMTPTPTETPTAGATPSWTATMTPVATVTVTPAATRTPTATATHTSTTTPTGTRTATATATLTAGWQTIFADSFEGAWPGAWTLYNNPGWGRTTCKAQQDSRSVWPAAAGTGAVTPCVNNYPNNLNAQMIHGPFSLVGATAAEVTFWRWQQSEEGYDKLLWLASVDGSTFSGWSDSGDTGGWVQETFDLSTVYQLGDLRGRPQVWIMFAFQSDYSETDVGVFLDDVVIRKR